MALPNLFALGDIENKAVLKKVALAHQALGELKGIAQTIPNPSILLGRLPLQEAKKFVVEDMQVQRNTAMNYLNKLSDIALLEKVKIGKENYYINIALYRLLESGET